MESILIIIAISAVLGIAAYYVGKAHSSHYYKEVEEEAERKYKEWKAKEAAANYD